MQHLPTQIDVTLTSDRSLLHILERWLEGSQALDRLHCHILTVLHTTTARISFVSDVLTHVCGVPLKQRADQVGIQVYSDWSVHVDTPGSILPPCGRLTRAFGGDWFVL